MIGQVRPRSIAAFLPSRTPFGLRGQVLRFTAKSTTDEFDLPLLGSMIDRPFYKHPPVIERVMSVHAEMSEELFESRFEEWRAIVEKEYPVYEPLKEWLIQVEEKEGIPLFDTVEPELRITPRFSKKRGSEGFDWSIRCPPGQFTMNMHSSPNQGSERRYRNLRAEFSEWLPKWLDHFSVISPKRVSMHYVNLINHQTLPKFMGEEHIFLDQILTVFAQIPGEHEALIQPYECQATLLLRGREKATLRISVNDWSNARHGVAVRLDFFASAPIFEGEQNAEALVNVLDWCHDRIVDRFEVVFTPKAKETFEPVKR